MDKAEIVIGTYENHLLGYKITHQYDKDLTLQSSFTDDSHRGAIRCLNVSSTGILASSSTDDSIRLHSLRKRREVGSLFQHEGSVNSIRFFKGGHMLSASEDGTIGLWKCRTWELLRLLKGHKSHVKAVAVHPSGKLGFSIGSDRSLFTWDFTTGKVAFKTHTEKMAEDILFTRDGDHYILVYQKAINVCSVQDTKVVQEIDYGSRINSVAVIKDDVLAVGGDDRYVMIFNFLTGEELLKVDCGKPDETFTGRIRCLSTFCIEEETFLVTSTTSGTIKVFQLNMSDVNSNSETILSYETGVRVTCMTTYVCSSSDKEEHTESSFSQGKSKVKKPKKQKTKVRHNQEDSEDKNESDNEPENESEEILDEEEDFPESSDKQDEENTTKKKVVKKLKKGRKDNQDAASSDGPLPKKKREKN